MGADLEVRVLYRGGNPHCEPRARASPRGGVRRKPEARPTTGGIRSGIRGVVAWVSWPSRVKPWLPRGGSVDATGAGGQSAFSPGETCLRSRGGPTGEAARPTLSGQESAGGSGSGTEASRAEPRGGWSGRDGGRRASALPERALARPKGEASGRPIALAGGTSVCGRFSQTRVSWGTSAIYSSPAPSTRSSRTGSRPNCSSKATHRMVQVPS